MYTTGLWYIKYLWSPKSVFKIWDDTRVLQSKYHITEKRNFFTNSVDTYYYFTRNRQFRKETDLELFKFSYFQKKENFTDKDSSTKKKVQ